MKGTFIYRNSKLYLLPLTISFETIATLTGEVINYWRRILNFRAFFYLMALMSVSYCCHYVTDITILQNIGAKIQTSPCDMDRSTVLQLCFLIIWAIVSKLLVDAKRSRTNFRYIKVVFIFPSTKFLYRFQSRDMCVGLMLLRSKLILLPPAPQPIQC